MAAPTPKKTRKLTAFVWTGTDRGGKTVNGELEGPNPAYVRSSLRRQGIQPKSVKKNDCPWMSFLKHTAITKLLKHVCDKVVTHPDEQTPEETSRKKHRVTKKNDNLWMFLLKPTAIALFFVGNTFTHQNVGKSSFVANV